jgi:hypothetical protein
MTAATFDVSDLVDDMARTVSAQRTRIAALERALQLVALEVDLEPGADPGADLTRIIVRIRELR